MDALINDNTCHKQRRFSSGSRRHSNTFDKHCINSQVADTQVMRNGWSCHLSAEEGLHRAMATSPCNNTSADIARAAGDGAASVARAPAGPPGRGRRDVTRPITGHRLSFVPPSTYDKWLCNIWSNLNVCRFHRWLQMQLVVCFFKGYRKKVEDVVFPQCGFIECYAVTCTIYK